MTVVKIVIYECPYTFITITPSYMSIDFTKNHNIEKKI